MQEFQTGCEVRTSSASVTNQNNLKFMKGILTFWDWKTKPKKLWTDARSRGL